ncbi:MAG TPA: glycosyl hydrolase [Bacteroidales bacterium]
MKRLIFIFFVLGLLLLGTTAFYSQETQKKHWLEYKDLSLQKFNDPGLDYAPYTRWWWPGNDVTKDELIREINLFANNHFGGVEIQPLALVLPTKGPGRADRIMSYDTPLYYDNLRTVFEEAQKKGLTVDMTDGSGWPTGGPHLTEADNNLTLEYGVADIPSGNTFAITVPRATRGDRPSAKLVALLAVKVLKDTSSANKTFVLDPKSIVNITDRVKANKFTFTPPDNSWKAIAFWSMADMERPLIIAKREAGFAMNHFDSTKVIKNYNYFFGERTGMEEYFGKPMRAIFDDSYEFRADRHFSDDLISTFLANRGYDITPYLPVNIWYGYNNMYYRMDHPDQKPDFAFSGEDWRLRYDYDLTLSDIIGRHFLQTTKNWTESRGLLHRTQPYGLNMDIMATAGLASIPEVETMQFNKGTEGGYKLITSGAHLYNRPIVSCEAAVYINRAFMTTPQKLKLTIDKILSCGVNQIIWHGTAYRYFPDGYPKEGWYPFINAHLPINFSSNISESDPYWKYMKDINTYAQRAQYVLRSGKPQADVLIYYPFLNYSEETFNPNETLLNGYIKEVEPPLPAENVTASFNRKIDTEWLNEIWPLINELNARGITWDWVNDASIRELSVTKDKQLIVRGNKYKAVILFDLPYIQLTSAQQLKKLSKSGANILAIGNLPVIQPGYDNFEANDKETAKEIAEALKTSSSTQIKSISNIDTWCNKLNIPVRYPAKYGFIRQIRRIMDDESMVQFLWNQSDAWQKVEITVDKSFKNFCWLDAEKGSIIRADRKEDGSVEYLLPPFSTIFLYSSANPINNVKQLPVEKTFHLAGINHIVTIEKWNIQSDSVQIPNTVLFDWKTNGQLKYSSSEGVYTSTFDISHIQPQASYFIDLDKVWFSAEVTINGKSVGSRIFTPFVFNVTDFLKTGLNEIRITVTPTQLNNFIGEANNGNKLYKEFKDKDLMSQGLIGPVIVYEQKNREE